VATFLAVVPADPEDAAVVLVELNLVELRYQAVLEELNGGATVTDVARRLAPTVLSVTTHPRSRSSACTRGDPQVRGMPPQSSR
jgi:hypothetical protein